VTNPDLVLADEPTGALDSTSGAAVLEVAAAANRRIYIRDGLIERDEANAIAGAR